MKNSKEFLITKRKGIMRSWLVFWFLNKRTADEICYKTAIRYFPCCKLKKNETKKVKITIEDAK